MSSRGDPIRIIRNVRGVYPAQTYELFTMAMQEILKQVEPQYYPDVLEAGSLSAILTQYIGQFVQQPTTNPISGELL